MGLETGTGIGDLVPTNPLSTDAVSSGDDHIRLIKTVMQSITFFKSIQTFTASGTWTRPAGVKKILIYCQGGGSGGGGGSAGGYSGGGGASGAIAIKWLDVTVISTATVTIGAGGTGGAGTVVGNAGELTSFVSAGPVNHCVAREGPAGSVHYIGANPQPTGLSTGDIVFAGQVGQNGAIPPPGGTTFGAQGGGAGGTTGASAQANSSGGGGGGESTGSTGGAGTAGGSGYCFILEFGW